MTNHWLDLKNAKVFLIEGSNAAENHSMSMKWLMKAKEKGAIVIHVDPRFNRTSSIADLYARIRPGTDIAFLNSMINYVLETNAFDAEYVKLHTNALLVVKDDYQFDEGVFSGYQSGNFKYDNASWQYALGEDHKPLRTESLDDPRCVFSKLRAFFKRYSLQTGSDISGVPAATIKKIADTMIANRPGTILYALGMTQHTVGVQNIRSFGVLQMLLGNLGKPGGGINALRGEPNVQGASDMALLFNYLPGYLTSPSHTEPTLKDWTAKYGTFRAKFLVNLLKAWFGDSATPENDFGYAWLPKKNGGKNYSLFRLFETSIEGKTKLLYSMGQNPMVTSPNLSLVHAALSRLDMLVVADLFMTETASFWERPGTDPASIQTEVLFLPAGSSLEKEGTITNSGRMVQWRYAGIPPVGEAKGDLEIIDRIYRRVRELYAGSVQEMDAVFKRGKWAYESKDMAEQVLREIGGYNLKTGDNIKGIAELQPDGTTSAGCWVYAGVHGGGKNLSKRRDNKTDPSGLGIYPGFAWTWPGNMHILYNRASCDAEGKPFDKAQAVIWWDPAQNKWVGHDTPDVPVATDGPATPNGQKPFRMTGEGVARLFAAPYKDPDPKAEGLPRDSSTVPVDGPLPEFYEPVESPTENSLHAKVASNPCLKYPRLKEHQPIGGRESFPYVLCTSSIAEHWCAGTVTRNIPWLNELVPEPIVELSEQLAKELGIRSGDSVEVSSARGQVVVKAVVTGRIQSLKIHGKDTPMVWMPYNWGFKGLSRGPSTNYLTIDAGDPNTWIQETKACLVNLKRVERAIT
jgi:formate dehydrogenase major subunit